IRCSCAFIGSQIAKTNIVDKTFFISVSKIIISVQTPKYKNIFLFLFSYEKTNQLKLVILINSLFTFLPLTTSSLPPSFLPSPYEFHSVVRGMTLRRLTSFVQSASGRLESEYKVNAKTV
ncbi:MAG: hypothetical protein VZR09_12145, partial [Candidatus Gastranaerophilaceae bacterium]|nr:hypothetical protein [Candidatus Gastranaerophilaceae bacterium]